MEEILESFTVCTKLHNTRINGHVRWKMHTTETNVLHDYSLAKLLCGMQLEQRYEISVWLSEKIIPDSF